MPLPKKINIQRLEEKVERLRSTEKWQRYYTEIISKSSLTKSPFKDEEEAKRYIDKLVLMNVDAKNPFSTFDDFWRNRKKND